MLTGVSTVVPSDHVRAVLVDPELGRWQPSSLLLMGRNLWQGDV